MRKSRVLGFVKDMTKSTARELVGPTVAEALVNLFAKFHASPTNAAIDYVFFGLHITICIAILRVTVTFLQGLTLVLKCSFWQAATVAILAARVVVAVFIPVACIVFPYLLNA